MVLFNVVAYSSEKSVRRFVLKCAAHEHRPDVRLYCGDDASQMLLACRCGEGASD